MILQGDQVILRGSGDTEGVHMILRKGQVILSRVT